MSIPGTHLEPVVGSGSITDLLTTGKSAYYDIDFGGDPTGDAVGLNNISMQVAYAKVHHTVQAKEFNIGMCVDHIDMGDSQWKWTYLTGPEEFEHHSQLVRDLKTSDTTFTKVGVQVHIYGKDKWLTDFTTKSSVVSVRSAIVDKLFYARNRLWSRVAVTAMLQPQIKQTQTSTQWDFGDLGHTVTAFPNTNIGARVKNQKLEMPDYSALQDIIKFFLDKDIDEADLDLYALMTPNIRKHLLLQPEFYNKDYIFSVGDYRYPVVEYGGIKWVKVPKSVTPGAIYADKYIVKGGASDDKLQVATATATNNIDLTATNHEVIPIWMKSNIQFARRANLDRFIVGQIPSKRYQTALIVDTVCGASRLENEKQYNLVVPII